LNFGNPERPEIMGQFVYCVRGIAEACKALDFPVVSGNVSLYNETNGEAILPTPTIGGVALIDDWRKSATLAFKAPDETIILVGGAGTHLGQTLYLREILGREEGAPPPVDLVAEKRAGDLVRGLIADGLATAVHDLSDGGLAVALAEMAMASGIGARVEAAGGRPVAFFFGEDQARYVLTLHPDDLGTVEKRAAAAGVAVSAIGRTGGENLQLGAAPKIPVEELRAAHESWFPCFMDGK
jgi:phosphoribosylformylglycinamidine synthase